MKEVVLTHLAGLDAFVDKRDSTDVTLVLRAQAVTGDEYELMIAPELVAHLIRACADISQRIENGAFSTGRTKLS